ncbi:glycosyltransferase family 2 protein [Aliarcobacter butzleri]|uniref:glycosyltransferase family 2 protein n=1 Tax=Aliarcobacter butzleri TaxID=28197 RepID=UPI003AF76C97
MNKEPLISIITPMYNAKIYIEETIQSVINQTYKNWEMIIIDNCSTDDSLEIIKYYQKYYEKIKYIKLDFNSGGPARPRNVGLKNAKGEFVAFLDADDVWLPEKLEKQIRFLEENPDVDICHTLANIIDGNGIKKGLFNNQRVTNKLKYIMKHQSVLFYTNNVNINSVFMKADNNMRFDEDKNLVALEDWKCWIEAIVTGKRIYLMKDVLLNYRIHEASISNRNSDIGYRKALYVLSKLFLDKKIPIQHFIFSSIFMLVKIFGKNI